MSTFKQKTILKLFNQSIPIFTTALYISILYYFSILKGMFLIWAFYKIYDLIMLKVFKLERISLGDTTFMWNTPHQTYNLFIVLSLDKMDTEGIKNLLIEKGLKKFCKFRSMLTFKFFDWWWQEVPLSESIKRIEVIDKAHNLNLKNKEDLTRWAYKELAVKFDLENELPFKFMIVENDENESSLKNLLIFKADHCLSDGVAIMNFICGMADNYSPSLFPATMSKSFNKIFEFVSSLVSPYYLLYIAYRLLFELKTVNSPFKIKKTVTGSPYISISERLDLEEYIKINKNLGITFNDMMVSGKLINI